MTTSRQLIDAVNLLCEYAIRRLPPGYQLSLGVLNGEATVELIDDDGEEVEWFADLDYACWEAACDAATEDAKDDEEEPNK